MWLFLNIQSDEREGYCGNRPASLNTNVVLFDHGSPAIELLFDDSAKFIWRISDRLHVESFQFLANRWLGHDLDHGCADSIQDRCWGICRRNKTDPGAGLDAIDT